MLSLNRFFPSSPSKHISKTEKKMILDKTLQIKESLAARFKASEEEIQAFNAWLTHGEGEIYAETIKLFSQKLADLLDKYGASTDYKIAICGKSKKHGSEKAPGLSDGSTHYISRLVNKYPAILHFFKEEFLQNEAALQQVNWNFCLCRDEFKTLKKKAHAHHQHHKNRTATPREIMAVKKANLEFKKPDILPINEKPYEGSTQVELMLKNHIFLTSSGEYETAMSECRKTLPATLSSEKNPRVIVPLEKVEEKIVSINFAKT